MMKTNKIALGLATITLVGILAHTTQAYAYYEKEEIIIHPVTKLGKEIQADIKIEATVVKSSNPDDWYYGFSDPEIKGYRGSSNRIEKVSDVKKGNSIVKLTETYTCIDETMIKKSWDYDNGNWYYRDINGICVYAWQEINNNWYFFESTGAMKTGWQRWENKWYYLGSDGAMVTSTTIDGYTIGADGAML